MRRRRRSKLPVLFIAAGAVFVGAVLWQVLPRGSFESDSAVRLKEELSQARTDREKELQAELEGLRRETRRLRLEIERIEGTAVE